jgi:Carboxypeptidase regulatory-like domain
MRRVALLYFCFLLVSAVTSFAQVNTGRVLGLITDHGGAVVPGVAVTATADGTGVVTRGTTTDSGEYLLNFLVPGTYSIQAEKAGFNNAKTLQVTVHAGDTARVDFTLQVGAVSQSVAVMANPISVATESSELSQTFGYKDLDSLPNIDRNPLYQMNLLPGANNDVGSGNYGSNGGENGSAVGLTRPQLASIGGVDANANTIYIEGVFNREPQNAYIGLTPPIEGIQEVQVYTGKYNAEFGFSGSAVVNIITKSGGSGFHGALFEFLRNETTDAQNYFASPGDSTPFRRNQFGGAIGGPILKEKLFFFADFQGTMLKTSTPELTSAPTAKMLQGDFSELYDPTQGKDNAGNTWGQLYDPFSRKFDASGNVISATPFPNNLIPQNRWDAAAAAINNAKVFGVANLPGLSDNLHYIGSDVQHSYQGDGRIDYSRSPRDRIFFRYSALSATNDSSTNVNQFFQDGNADSNSYNQNLQLTDMFSFSSTRMNELRLGYNRSNVHTSNKALDKNWNNFFGIFNGNLEDSSTQGLAEFSIPGVHDVAEPDWVGYIISNTISVTDNFTWVKGHHIVKAGVNLNHIQDTSADTIGGDDPRGSLVFDQAMTSYDGNNTDPYGYAPFLLGTMVSSSRARFVKGAPYQTYWQNAWYAQDDYKVLPSLTLNLGLRYELTTRPVERSNRQSNWDTRTDALVLATSSDRSPGLGLDTDDWGPRLGFAWTPDHGKTSIRGGYGISYWMAYWSGPVTILGLTYPNYAKQSLLTPNNLTPTLSLATNGLPIATASYDSSGNLIIPDDAVIRGADYNWKNQRVDQQSLNIERELRPGMVLDIGYLGVRGRNNNFSKNINQAPPTAPGVDYNTQRPLYSKYPQLGDIPISTSISSTWYDALTARLAANIGNSVNMNVGYAHGRNFQNGNNLDQNNINQYYGPTQQDIAHLLNAQVSVQLPFGRGRRYLGKANRLVDSLLGGWEYDALVHVRSGVRFDVTTYDTTSLNNGQTNRADRVGNGKLSHPTVAKWFDTSAFVVHATPMTYGNAGINPLYSDGQQQLDSSLAKTFHVTERQQIEFRVDAFNTFNHPNFSAPDSTVGDDAEGQVSSTSVDNRRLQFALRYAF